MTRRGDGTWEISHREVKWLMMVWPLIGVIFSAGAAWAGVRYGLEGKVDKTTFAAVIATRDSTFAIHVQQTALIIQSLRVSDSLQQSAQRESNERLREIVCDAIKRPGCR